MQSNSQRTYDFHHVIGRMSTSVHFKSIYSLNAFECSKCFLTDMIFSTRTLLHSGQSYISNCFKLYHCTCITVLGISKLVQSLHTRWNKTKNTVPKYAYVQSYLCMYKTFKISKLTVSFTTITNLKSANFGWLLIFYFFFWIICLHP